MEEKGTRREGRVTTGGKKSKSRRKTGVQNGFAAVFQVEGSLARVYKRRV